MRNESRNSIRNRLNAGGPETEKTNRRAGKGKSILKKGSCILREGNRINLYEFILEHQSEFGIRWMLKEFSLSPNTYYNHLKDRNKNCRKKKTELLATIQKTYHENNGTAGYRMIGDLIRRQGISISYPTVYKYMKELGLSAIINRKKTPYRKGESHRVYDNLLGGCFNVSGPNKVWCTDFTYLQLAGGNKRYNCSIIDLYDRSVIATLNSKYIDAKLAMDTLNLGLGKHRPPGGLILHSDQGSQFTSFDFTDFCTTKSITQSMSRVGTPGDNAVMERFYNSFKNEFTNVFSFSTDEDLNEGTSEYAYAWYNHSRPHSYNQKKTPFETRYGKSIKL